MKKLITTFGLLLLAVVIFAQGFHVGPRAGVTVSNMITKFNDGTVEYASKPGFQVGATAEFELTSFLYVGTTIGLYQKGYKNVVTPGVFTIRNTFSYIDIPIEVGYKLPIGNFSIFGQIGPYVSVAVVGQSRMVNHDMPEYNETYSVYEYDEYKRFDSGLSFAVGGDYKQFQIRANYAFGFIDMNKYETYSSVNSTFGFSFAYFFGRDY
ncbi:MAG: PorT family protein [Bacteroidales bacterium]|nr:PorT family protein [Bacteroidales bacterium]HOY39562.1 porin family protein [Bacteroidales bacterium]HQP03998.1 porin family protein [Bacteroidales bacterium]